MRRPDERAAYKEQLSGLSSKGREKIQRPRKQVRGAVPLAARSGPKGRVGAKREALSEVLSAWQIGSGASRSEL
jgi:hypothetical protein